MADVGNMSSARRFHNDNNIRVILIEDDSNHLKISYIAISMAIVSLAANVYLHWTTEARLCDDLKTRSYINYEPDYASASAGGQIVSVLSTKSYHNVADTFVNRILWSFADPKQYASKILQPNNSPGQCYAFKGSQGAVIIKLITHIHITKLTLEHIPVALSPWGNITSAPRHFSLTGLWDESSTIGIHLGDFMYDIHRSPVQQFAVEHYNYIKFDTVLLNITSNWGNAHYTCVYRMGIHGEL